MMDFHILIVITCVFLASLCSLLFINKFFRRKTFEEIIAEKKAMTDKIYGQNKIATKKPKKLQQLKKEQKREKKQRQKEQQRDNTEHEQEDSDAQSEPASVDDEPEGLSRVHVEFEPDPEVITYSNSESTRRVSNAEKENVGTNLKSKSKKDKKNVKSGILVNKTEVVAVKENVVEEQLNSFEVKQPKDVVELKKQEQKDKKDEKSQSLSQGGKKEKSNKKEKQVTVALIAEPAPVEVVNVAKELKQLDEKLIRQGSPKNQSQNNNNNNNKVNKQTKKQIKETAATKELVVALDKLSETDTIGVQLLMNLFRRAELNRSEIQILIDYLLNKQQDMPSSHSEWSDDICQKLKRQLEEKERALAEEQEASIGIQAKLRDLRTEVNTERAQMNATIKAYIERIQSKEQEITGLNQETQTLNDKIALERQQFQAKLLREKQVGSQDLLQQLQMMQNELAHKDKCITELTCIVNASRQAVEESQQKTSELIQTQVQQIRALEQQRDELEQLSNNRVFEIEQAKTLETENAEYKVEIRNLQNALESTKADLLQNLKELDTVKSELALTRTVELVEKQNEIQILKATNTELTQQIAGFNNKSVEQSKEQLGLQASLDALKAQVAEKGQQVAEFSKNNATLLKELTDIQSHQQQQEQQQVELKKNLDVLKTEVAEKNKKLLDVEQTAEKYSVKENELLQQLQEQKEKNNDLRMKNWKLVEALQIAETTAKQNKQLSNTNASLVQQQQSLAAAQNLITTATTTTDSSKDQKEIRELFQRLYPDAVKASAGTALSLSFDQWIEQVLAIHIKQSISKFNSTTSSSNKSTQSSNSSNSSSNHNSHNNTSSEPTTVTSENDVDEEHSGGESDAAEMQKLRTQNAQLMANVDELTKLVKKTGNTLSELETHAREQDEHWRSIVLSKDEQINSLQHSNGEQNI